MSKAAGIPAAAMLPVFLLGVWGMASLSWAGEFDVRNEAEFSRVVTPDSRVEKLAGGFQFTEGPVWMPSGAGFLIFSDIPANELRAWNRADGVSMFRAPSEQANGNTLDLQGRLVTCEHRSRRVTVTEKDGTVRVLVDRYRGKKLNSPNDLVVKSDGTIWFTDPPYGLSDRSLREQPRHYVFRFDPERGKLEAVVDDFDMPNGLCFSPDERKLYIADSGKPHHIRVFRVESGGTLTGGEVFCVIDQGVPDGICCDTAGRLYSSAGDGVQVFATDGSLIGKILVPESPANLCFGGSGNSTLFMTARTSVYAITLGVSGGSHRR